ncbi:MAG: MMPL family transporter [Cognaticolwellia aestuarii]
MTANTQPQKNKPVRHSFQTWLALASFILALILVVVASVQGRFVFQADMLALLPDAQTRDVRHQSAEQLLFERYKNNAIVAISIAENSPIEQQARAITLDLKQSFEQQGWHSENAEYPDFQQIIDFFGQYQGMLLTLAQRQKISAGESMSEDVLAQLSSALNPVTQSSFSADPSLTVGKFIESALSQNASQIRVEQGLLTATDAQDSQKTKHYLLILTLPDDAASIVQAQHYAQQIKNQVNQATEIQPDISVSFSGIVFHNAENAEQAAFEMSLFSGLSLVAMFALVLYFFRRFSALVAVVIGLTHAVCFGLLALLIFFDAIHLISAVFSITLIGIAIDYCFHMLTDLTAKSGQAQPSKVKASIALGFVSTAIGYGMFLLTPMVFFGQIAVFIIFGLLGAIISAFYLVPLLVGDKSQQNNKPPLNSVGSAIAGKLITEKTRLTSLIAVLLMALVMGQFFNPLSFNDSIALLNASSKELLTSEQRHQQWLTGKDAERIIILADSDQELLVLEEQLIADMAKAFPQASVQALSSWVPSEQQQLANKTLLKQANNQGLFDGVNQLLETPIEFDNNKLLTITDALESPIAPLVRASYLTLNSSRASVIQVNYLTKGELQQLIADKPYAYLVDKAGQLSQLMTLSRENLINWLVSALLAFIVVICLKFSWRIGIKTSMALLITFTLSMLLSALIQGPLNLFNVLALVLIFALAIDYLIFYQNSGLKPMNVMAITLSAISSILVFGMLIMSKTPAIFSFGLTVMIGIICIYLIAPLTIRGTND